MCCTALRCDVYLGHTNTKFMVHQACADPNKVGYAESWTELSRDGVLGTRWEAAADRDTTDNNNNSSESSSSTLVFVGVNGSQDCEPVGNSFFNAAEALKVCRLSRAPGVLPHNCSLFRRHNATRNTLGARHHRSARQQRRHISYRGEYRSSCFGEGAGYRHSKNASKFKVRSWWCQRRYCR